MSTLKTCNACGKIVSDDAEVCPHCGESKPTFTLTKMFFNFIYSIFTFIVGYYVVGYILDDIKKDKNSADIPSNKATISTKELASRNVSIDVNPKLTAGGSGLEIDITIKNTNSIDIKDIEVTCEHYAQSGTKIDSNTRTIYEIVPAKTSKLISNFDIGFIHSQVKKTSCFVDDFIALEMGGDMKTSEVKSDDVVMQPTQVVQEKRRFEKQTNKSKDQTILEALNQFGDIRTYGFDTVANGDKSIKLKHGIVGFYDFSNKGDKGSLGISYSVPEKEYDCHACAPKLSFFIFSTNNGQSILEESYINTLEFGQWGKAPSLEDFKVIELGENMSGLALDVSGGGQGFSEGFRHIFMPLNKKFQKIFSVQTASDDSGAVETSIESWKSTFDFIPGNGALNDIVMRTSGIREGKIFNDNTVYTFDGQKYNITRANNIQSTVAENTKSGSGDYLANYAHELMTGRSLSDAKDIKVKYNSKGVKIYCTANMSMCKTEAEVRDYFENR